MIRAGDKVVLFEAAARRRDDDDRPGPVDRPIPGAGRLALSRAVTLSRPDRRPRYRFMRRRGRASALLGRLLDFLKRRKR